MLQRCTVISVMNLVSELDLPEFDYSAADFSADRYHEQLAETRQRGWLAKSPLAYVVLDRDAGEFFLRSRKTAFPGRQIAGVLRRYRRSAGRAHRRQHPETKHPRPWGLPADD